MVLCPVGLASEISLVTANNAHWSLEGGYGILFFEGGK